MAVWCDVAPSLDRRDFRRVRRPHILITAAPAAPTSHHTVTCAPATPLGGVIATPAPSPLPAPQVLHNFNSFVFKYRHLLEGLTSARCRRFVSAGMIRYLNGSDIHGNAVYALYMGALNPDKFDATDQVGPPSLPPLRDSSALAPPRAVRPPTCPPTCRYSTRSTPAHCSSSGRTSSSVASRMSRR